MKNNHVTIAVLKAQKGKKEKLKEELLKLIEPTRSEAGCLEYILFEDKTESNTFYMWEVFKDLDAIKLHDESSYFKNFETQMNELMREPIRLIELEEVLK